MAIYDDKTKVTLLDSQVPFVPGVLPPSLEKRYMNPIRYRTNYRIVPGYAAFCGICIILVLILGGIDDQKFMPVMIGLFALIGVASVGLMISVPKTRQKELALENERYDFDVSGVEQKEKYFVELEGLNLEFGQNGLTVNGKFYWYNHLSPRLVTSNRFNRIWIAVRFGGADDVSAVFAPLMPELLKAIEQFSIPLENPEMLAYLRKRKQNAFAQIYNSGSFKVYDD